MKHVGLRTTRRKFKKTGRVLCADAEQIAKIPARETTRIDEGDGMLGAMAYFAILAYPGTTARDHAKRDQLITAMWNYISGVLKYRQGMQRITSGRAKAYEIPRPTLKNATVFRACQRAERIIIERRLVAFGCYQSIVLDQLFGGGESCLSEALATIGKKCGLNARTARRYWDESLPVLHLAHALFTHAPMPGENDRQDLIIRLARDHKLWLQKALEAAENSARYYMPLEVAFDPAKRIALIRK
jgi:hypothetical protein